MDGDINEKKKKRWSLLKGRVFQWPSCYQQGGWNREEENQDEEAILKICRGIRRWTLLGPSEKPMKRLLELSPWMQTLEVSSLGSCPAGSISTPAASPVMSQTALGQKAWASGHAYGARWRQTCRNIASTALEGAIRGRTEGPRAPPWRTLLNKTVLFLYQIFCVITNHTKTTMFWKHHTFLHIRLHIKQRVLSQVSFSHSHKRQLLAVNLT